jgi:hypothetical protein
MTVNSFEISELILLPIPTLSSTPLKLKAPPTLPVVQPEVVVKLKLTKVPLFPLPE